MQSVRGAALRSARQSRQRLQTETRRYESHGSHKSHDSHHHSGPVNEPLGTAFLVTAAAIPLSIAVYTLSGQGTDTVPYFTKKIRDTYNSYSVEWAKRNEFHTNAVEQAAEDRQLFLNQNISGPKWIDHRYPEQLNGGSPWNVPAGQGSINLDAVIEKYTTQAREHDELRRQQLKDNTLPIEQPVVPSWKKT